MTDYVQQFFFDTVDGVENKISNRSTTMAKVGGTDYCILTVSESRNRGDGRMLCTALLGREEEAGRGKGDREDRAGERIRIRVSIRFSSGCLARGRRRGRHRLARQQRRIDAIHQVVPKSRLILWARPDILNDSSRMHASEIRLAKNIIAQVRKIAQIIFQNKPIEII